MLNFLLTLLSFVFVGIVPGFLIYKIIFKNKKSKFYETLPMSLCLSLAVLLIPTFLAYYFSLSLNFVIYFFLAAFVLILALFMIVYRGKIPKFKKQNLNICLKILLVICLILLIRAVFSPGFAFGDAIRHISEIKKIVELPQIDSGSSLIKEYRGINNYGYNVWHIFWGIISKFSGLDILDNWYFSPLLVVGFLMLAYFFFSKEMFNSEKIAIFSTAVFFVWYFILNYHFSDPVISNCWLWAESSVPSFIARGLVMFMALGFVFKYIRNAKKEYLYLVSILTLVVSFVHFYYFLILVFLLGSILVFSLIFRHKDKILIKRLFLITVFAVIPSVFYVFYIHQGLSPLENPVHLSSLISGNKPYEIIRGFPVMDPFKIVYSNFVHWFSFLLAPLLIFFIRKKRYALYLFTFFMAPALIIFNPFIVKLLQGFNPSLDRIWRLNELMPFTQMFGLFLFLGWEKTGRFMKTFISKQNKGKLFLVGIIMFVVLISLFGKSILISYLGNSKCCFDEFDYFWEEDFKEKINDSVLPGSVVLMDNLSANIWTDYYSHYVVSVNWGMDNYIPPQFNQTERYNDVEKYIQQKNLDEWSFGFMDKYEIDYILVNKSVVNNEYEIAPELPDPFYNPYPEKIYYPEKDFSKYPERFELVWDSENLSFYKYKK